MHRERAVALSAPEPYTQAPCCRAMHSWEDAWIELEKMHSEDVGYEEPRDSVWHFERAAVQSLPAGHGELI